MPKNGGLPTKSDGLPIKSPAGRTILEKLRLVVAADEAQIAPTHGDAKAFEAADKLVDDRLAMPVTSDANDFIYQWEASHDYNPSAGMERIEATVLAINAADDERNPPETGLLQQSLKRVANGRLFLITASAETRGHGTTGMAKFWKQQFQDFLKSVPPRPTRRVTPR